MAIFRSNAWLACSAISLTIVSGLSLHPARAGSDRSDSTSTIGATAHIEEQASGIQLTARVDTGARITSLHCEHESLQIKDESPDPEENIGKPARLRVENKQGEASWIDTEIESYVEVRNAEHAERRYCVRLPLEYEGVVRKVLVTLNDRSSMTYHLLLGRNFLRGAYVVDVANPGPGAPKSDGQLH